MDALVLPALDAAWDGLDALIVVDQVSEAECGVVTSGARKRLAEIGTAIAREVRAGRQPRARRRVPRRPR